MEANVELGDALRDGKILLVSIVLIPLLDRRGLSRQLQGGPVLLLLLCPVGEHALRSVTGVALAI